jgi:mannan endo-1,4-beta-mannosidase
MKASFHAGHSKVAALLCLGAALFPTAWPSAQTQSGIRVQGDKVLDANGSPFLMAGLNHAHTWYKNQLGTALPAIAATGSNTVRIVLANGGRWTRDEAQSVADIISQAKQRQMISVLEVHDATGYPEQSGSVSMSTAVDYWIQIKGALEGQEKFAIINIANEPFGNNVSADTYVDAHKTAISRLRAAGLRHALMVDAANWGQDWQNVLRDRAGEILEADPDRNVIFSVHMYDVYDTDAKVNTYMQAFKSRNLALVVGEFAADHGANKPVAAAAILRRAREHGYGFLGWSWKGNGSGLESLDIAATWNGSQLSSWGQLLINGEDGIRKVSVKAGVFGGTISLAPRPSFVEEIRMDQGALTFILPREAQVRVRLLDVRGRTAAVVSDGPLAAGFHRMTLPRPMGGVHYLDLGADGQRRTLRPR